MAESTWWTVEVPILEDVYEMEREDSTLILSPVDGGKEIADRERVLATIRLIDNGYLHGTVRRSQGGRPYSVRVTGLTGLGLQAIRAWPSRDAAGEAFLEALQRLIEDTQDPEERTRLEKLKGVAGDVGKASLSAAVVSVVRGLSGMP